MIRNVDAVTSTAAATCKASIGQHACASKWGVGNGRCTVHESVFQQVALLEHVHDVANPLVHKRYAAVVAPP